MLINELGLNVKLILSSEYLNSVLYNNKNVLTEIINEKDIILMQGGGNFGDLWRYESEKRNAMLKLFPNNKIVFLPQTINYQNMTFLKRDQREFSFKPNLIITVRSEESLLQATNNFKQTKTVLVPDMAFLLGDIEINSPQILYDVLILRRYDKESKYPTTLWHRAYKDIFNFKYSYLDVDWFFYDDNNLTKEALKRRKPTEAMSFLKELAENRLLLISKIMSQARIVVTDRLHPSIYCVLIGKPHVIVDEKYKKIFNTRETAFKNKPECSDQYLNAYYAQDPGDAILMAVNILNKKN